MIYNDEWAFIHIPRTGGTSLKISAPTAINPIEEENVLAQIYQHQPYHHWQKQIDLSNKTVFSIVRNPYKRAISLWLFCTQSHPIISAHLKGTSLRDFWDIDVEKLVPAMRYNMRTTQCEFLTGLGGELVDTVFRIEDGLEPIKHRLGIQLKRKANALPSYSYMTYYTQETYDLITDMFGEDFDQFGYEKLKWNAVL